MAKFWLHWVRLCYMAFLFFSSEELQASVFATNIKEIADEPFMGGQDIQELADENYFDWQKKENLVKELNFNKLEPDDFTGVRAKKDIRNKVLGNADNWQNFSEQEFMEKLFENRRNQGQRNFNGMHGTKIETDYGHNVVDLPKFQQYKRNEILQELLDGLNTIPILESNAEKRAPVGFTGMRGKRPNDYSIEINAKEKTFDNRALNDAYTGMNGKKDADHQSFKRSSYFDRAEVVGRKRFPDFANKFVAVRGKKDIDYDRSGKSLNTRQLYFVDMFPTFFYGSNGKRTPSGFLGMRGKRHVAPIANAQWDMD